jgi:hypothetical protein
MRCASTQPRKTMRQQERVWKNPIDHGIEIA